jgi:hypothetical protein
MNTAHRNKKEFMLWWYGQKRKSLGQIEREMQGLRKLREALGQEEESAEMAA